MLVSNEPCTFPQNSLRAPADTAGIPAEFEQGAQRPGDLDQARRLHRDVHRRQQDPEARDQGADIVLTQGATQSNHARQTAACAAKMRIDCHILLEDRTGKTDHDYTESGNVLLDHLHGASVERCAANPDMNGELAKVAARLKSEGRKPYLIPGGGSNPTGALGYVNAAMELIGQANDSGLRIDHVVHATGSAGTQAGLITGLAG